MTLKPMLFSLLSATSRKDPRRKKSRVHDIISDLSPTGLRLGLWWLSGFHCASRVEQYTPALPPGAMGHLQQESMRVVFLSKEVVVLGQMARKFLKVSEMAFLSLFLAKKDGFCGSD